MKRTATKLTALAIIAVLALSMLTGCSNGTALTKDPAEKGAAGDEGRRITQTTDPAPELIPLAKAKEIALGHAKTDAADAVFTDREYDLEDGTPVYELEFSANGAEYEYHVHAESGEILYSEKELEPAPPSVQPAPVPAPAAPPAASAPAITDDEAIAIALQHAGVAKADALVEPVERDLDDGIPVIEVEFDAGRTEYSYEIHAETGAILEADKDIDD